MGAWGIQPSEFWAMSPEEFWWLHEVKTPRDKSATGFAGGMKEEDVRELYEMLH